MSAFINTIQGTITSFDDTIIVSVIEINTIDDLVQLSITNVDSSNHTQLNKTQLKLLITTLNNLL
jgi:predicted RNA-binding protein with RPS1 domain